MANRAMPLICGTLVLRVFLLVAILFVTQSPAVAGSEPAFDVTPAQAPQGMQDGDHSSVAGKMDGGGDRDAVAQSDHGGDHGDSHSAPTASGHGAPSSDNPGSQPASSHSSGAVASKHFTLIEKGKLQGLDEARNEKPHSAGINLSKSTVASHAWRTLGIGFLIAVLVGAALHFSGVYNRLNISKRLILGFGVVSSTSIGMGVVSIYSLGAVSDAGEMAVAATSVERDVFQLEATQNRFLLMGIEDPALGKEILNEHAELRAS